MRQSVAIRRCLLSDTDRWCSLLGAHHQPPSNHSFHSFALQAPRYFSAVPLQEESPQHQPIRILYASQGGTAQIFAQQLAEALEEYYQQIGVEIEVTIEGCHESKPPQLLAPGNALHVFLVSVTGVGEPPDNGRAFYEWIQSKDATNLSNLEYTVFGLGNSKAHPNHYNTIGIHLDKRLEELGGKRAFPLGLGDDGDCIEDDFDTWMESFLKFIQKEDVAPNEKSADESPPEASMNEDTTEMALQQSNELRIPCSPGVAKSPDGRRLVSAKHPTLQLSPPAHDYVSHDLFHLQSTPQQFYSDFTMRARVTKSRSLSAYGGEAGLREVAVSLPQGGSYTTGDHCLVYPRNAGCMVEAYLNLLDVNPHAIIDGDEKQQYPFPTGLTVYETLSHCVDLGASPSPTFSRFLLGRRELDYKQEIANPRRTAMDLLLEQQRSISLEDLLFHMTPIKPRYYSIASSSLASPSEIRLTFRPVKYVSSQGRLREGICTNYMASMVANADEKDEKHTQYMAVSVCQNPSFRLPQNPETPVLLIAGGCGVAPIRAFVEERVFLAQQNPGTFGPGWIYLGFRSPEDEAYRSLLDKALEVGALTDAKVAYSYGCTEANQYCMNVNKLVREESQLVWDHLESGGYTYLCGGARTFGAAIEHELLEIIQEHGHMDFEGAENYLRKLIENGRLLEDLAD